jgi:hypothetical protein
MLNAWLWCTTMRIMMMRSAVVGRETDENKTIYGLHTSFSEARKWILYSLPFLRCAITGWNWRLAFYVYGMANIAIVRALSNSQIYMLREGIFCHDSNE